MNKPFRYFISGLIFVIPIWIIYTIIVTLASLTRNFIPNVLLSFIASVILLTLLGYFIAKVFNRRFRKKVKQKSEEKTIIGRIFYLISHYKESSEKVKKAFSNPILYKVDSGIYKIGFITTEDNNILNSKETDSVKSPTKDSVWVYAPYPINFTGEFLLVEMENIQKLENKKEELIPFILSAGIFNK